MEVKVLQNVLHINDKMARANRDDFAQRGLFALNVMSSPGSGKTTLLTETLQALEGRLRVGVVVGDICSSRDAQRLSCGGKTPVVQINTEPFGGDCHLDAHIVKDAADQLPLDDLDLLIVENIGNLVCPAEFDIGEDKRVAILSVAEGEDKPLKYPLMFRVCDATILSKIDLIPHLEYDLEATRKNIREINGSMPVLEVSAKSGQGMDGWIDWLTQRVKEKRGA